MQPSYRERKRPSGVVSSEGRPHARPREEDGHDDLHGVIPREPLAANGRSRGLSPIAIELHEQVDGAVDDAGLIADDAKMTKADLNRWVARMPAGGMKLFFMSTRAFTWICA